jgi:predicted PurR-regulated permease PerM
MDEGRSWRLGSGFKDGDFVRRVLIVIALLGLTYLFWRLSGVLLLVFGAVLVAVLLHAVAEVLATWTPVPRRWSLLAGGLLLLAVLLGMGVLFGAQMRTQLSGVAERLPLAVNSLSSELGLGEVYEQLPRLLGFGPGGEALSRVTTFSVALLGGLADFLLVVIAGIYIAADPSIYRKGLVKLFPRSEHERVEGAADAAGYALRMWLLGQLVAMALVFVMTSLALWLIGVPSPIALGLIAGLAEFVPLIGPFVGALPAVLIAFSTDQTMLLWTVAAFVIIQQIESNIIMPIVERRVVALPPALALFAVIVFGVLFGPLGLLFAVPLAVVVFVLVKKLYVKETLGEPTPVPGEDSVAPKAISAEARKRG